MAWLATVTWPPSATPLARITESSKLAIVRHVR